MSVQFSSGLQSALCDEVEILYTHGFVGSEQQREQSELLRMSERLNQLCELILARVKVMQSAGGDVSLLRFDHTEFEISLPKYVRSGWEIIVSQENTIHATISI